MRIKSLIGLAAILAALGVLGVINSDRFKHDTYLLCIGMASDGPKVTVEEQATCACMAEKAAEAIPWKSRLPRSLIRLSDEDNARMIAAQKTCRPDGGS